MTLFQQRGENSGFKGAELGMWNGKGKPGRFRVKHAGKPQGEKCSGQPNSDEVHASGCKRSQESREATSARGTNLEQESAEGSTEQVLMGKSRKR